MLIGTCIVAKIMRLPHVNKKSKSSLNQKRAQYRIKTIPIKSAISFHTSSFLKKQWGFISSGCAEQLQCGWFLSAPESRLVYSKESLALLMMISVL